MSNQQSVIYILGVPDSASPGQLIHIEEHPEALAAVYINPLEMRNAAVWDVNWLTRHQMGHGLWQQNWGDDSHEGRVHEPPRGLDLAVARWELVARDRLPDDVHVFPVEHEGRFIWYIRSGYATQALCDAVNAAFDRIVGDALWVQRWYDRNRFGIDVPDLPLLPAAEVELPLSAR
ncbi:hypothetical protein [Streptomyces neyagawaensis]|uniref:hypothetical protein n=1 Tax=Streptomyces neyagawaensis TaxID=42238 RepID=UPI0006E30FAD|nr:hypothetical protein [Streptomyces neyagawaensis]MCL6734359.1 hypothetical protein [Streptomyces neyagawaensis]MDE1681988.1 hypothetical protein [Streptomyces neyagawaensis]